MAKNKKKEKWIKFRHRVVRNIAYAVIQPYTRIKYGYKPEKYKAQGDRQYLILLNHQTPFDQFFCGMSFKGPIYYLATEDIFSNGWVSSLIRYLVAPIPIKKQTTDIAAVLNCLRVAREGGTLCIAPEGNRTYSGKTEYMSPTISSLAKRLKLPILLYKIEGGYGAEPRWSDVVRKGKVRGYVSECIEPEEFLQMTDDELFERIEKGLYVNEAVADASFRHKKRAEYLERAIYVCPECGFAEFESKNEKCRCKKCNKTIIYGENKEISGDGFEFPFTFVNDWYEYQKNFVNSTDTRSFIEVPIFEDRASIDEVIVYKNKHSLANDASIKLYGDRIVVNEGSENEYVFPFESVTALSVLGKNKCNIYYENRVFQLKGDKHFNALKYVNIYYRHKNILKGDENEQFLGL